MSFREPVRDKSFGEEWKAKPYSELTPEEQAKARQEVYMQRRAIQTAVTEPTPRKPTEVKGEAEGLYAAAAKARAVGTQLRVGASERFYKRIGYPQYAGIYPYFTIPTGYKVSGIEKTGEGLQVSFERVQRKGVAQTIYEFVLPGQVEYEKYQHVLGRVGFEEKVAPSKLAGSFVAPFEATFYAVGGLVGGVKKTVETGKPQLASGWEWAGLETPVIPATISGGLMSSGIESVLKGKPVASEELKEFRALTHEEKMAGLLGEITLAWMTGKAVQRVIVKPVQVKSQSWLTSKYLAKMEKGQLAWIGWKEKIVMRVTGARPYVARGEVALPQLTGEISFKQLQASQVAWEMTETPRMGGVWLRNLGVAPAKTKVLPHLIARAGKISVGYLRELSYEEPLWKRGLLPYVTQTQVTRAGILPYVPKAIVTTGKQGIKYLAVGFGLTALTKVKPDIDVLRFERTIKPLQLLTIEPKQKKKGRQVFLPKMWRPTLMFEREKFRPLTIETPAPKQTEKLIPMLRLPPLQIPTQKPFTIQKITQIPTLRTPPVPTQPRLAPPPLPYRLPHGGRDVSRGRRGLFGLWFKRTHKIKTPEQMLQAFRLTPRKTKKRKKKVREVKLLGF